MFSTTGSRYSSWPLAITAMCPDRACAFVVLEPPCAGVAQWNARWNVPWNVRWNVRWSARWGEVVPVVLEPPCAVPQLAAEKLKRRRKVEPAWPVRVCLAWLCARVCPAARLSYGIVWVCRTVLSQITSTLMWHLATDAPHSLRSVGSSVADICE